ncbi:hypothetical protein QOZ80_1BG0092180 [Eleusine coracana subsp. coracana]|nr:hypothetical protein QOZ80_1BG0092180 [Eleusine coracana subsp. coracana]
MDTASAAAARDLLDENKALMEESTVDASSSHADCGSLPLGSLPPVLVYDHGWGPNPRRQTAFAIRDQTLHTGVVPELVNNTYHVTPHGWVFLVAFESSPHTRLWDPRSGHSVSLPVMEHKLPENWECYLSDVPTAPSCIVLVLNIDAPNFLYCHVGDSRQWSMHEYDIGEVPVPPECTTTRKIAIQQVAAMGGGKFYFQESKDLGVMDFSSKAPELSYMDYPPISYPEGSNCRRDFLVGSPGELYHVYIYLKGFTPEILTVHVYEIDVTGQTSCRQRKVDNLGDKVLLVSYPNAQVLRSASKYGLKGNRVYFNFNVLEELDGGPIFIFELEDQSLETLRPSKGLTELMGNPFWVLPQSSA